MKYLTIILALLIINCGGIKQAARDLAEAVDNAVEVDKTKDKEDKTEDTTTEEEDYSSDETEEGSIILDTNIPEDRVFLGTFEKYFVYKSCGMFPEITRLYSHDNNIYIENNRQELLAVAVIFQDLTFDFDIEVASIYGTPYETLACTCNYDSSEWYGDEWDCSCEGDETSCNLSYNEYD